mmetsp:Transcript_18298/g.39592  ORF Transcript_18298/g.39592 Transcript_18298/m.39592 type:complete len:542 (+) Transcript_18298:106-1731(+)
MPPSSQSDDDAQAFLGERALHTMATHSFLIGLAIRLAIAISLPLLLDDGILLQGVRYTDIDYDVFTDAADYVASGRSPYERHTYRYTPFLAALLAWPVRVRGQLEQVNEAPLMFWSRVLDKRYFGRILFCLADAICGMIIVSLRRRARGRNGDDSDKSTIAVDEEGCGKLSKILRALQDPNIVDALWWMYNPLAINICTRGSAESFVVILPVLLTVAILTNEKGEDIAPTRSRFSVALRSFVAGIIHGAAIHSKLYPVIYTLSFMAYISYQEHGGRWKQVLPARNEPKAAADLSRFPWTEPKRLLHLIYLWIQRILLTPSPVIFLVVSLSTFGALTYLAVLGYGREALDEGFLYHFSRVDHRHNYSMHWYWIYLARGRIAQASFASNSAAVSASSAAAMAWLGRTLLLPQAVLLLYVSLGVAPYDLSLALFVQTFLFVAHNKVITAQYFTWYLCLLPLCSSNVEWNTRRIKLSLAYLGVAVVAWLGSAFCLEMQGMPVHLVVWLASMNFFVSNVNLLGAILSRYNIRKDASRTNELSKKEK